MFKTIIQLNGSLHTFTFGADSVEYQATVDGREQSPLKFTPDEAIDTIKDFTELLARLAAKGVHL